MPLARASGFRVQSGLGLGVVGLFRVEGLEEVGRKKPVID